MEELSIACSGAFHSCFGRGFFHQRRLGDIPYIQPALCAQSDDPVFDCWKPDHHDAYRDDPVTDFVASQRFRMDAADAASCGIFVWVFIDHCLCMIS